MIGRAAGFLRAVPSLVKLGVSAANAAACMFAYLVCAGRLTPDAIAPALAVAALAGGASVLNNVQDRDIDGRMERTKSRPLPMKRISPATAIAVALALIAGGACGLCLADPSLRSLAAGFSAVVLYNGLYTPLKRKSVIAIVPGVMCGMASPLAGWLAAGGGLASPRLWCVLALFGVWQVPHVWLIALSRPQDYLRSRIPSIRDTLAEPQVKRLVFTWTVALSALSILTFGICDGRFGFPAAAVLANTAVMPAIFAALLARRPRPVHYRALFHYLNVSVATAPVSIVAGMAL